MDKRIFDFINAICTDFKEYRHIFLALNTAQKRQFEDYFSEKKGRCIDFTENAAIEQNTASDKESNFLEVFPLDILMRGEYPIFVKLAREPTQNAVQVYKDCVAKPGRLILTSAPKERVTALEELLRSFMSPPEQQDFMRAKNLLPNPLLCKRHANAYGLHVIYAKNPL